MSALAGQPGAQALLDFLGGVLGETAPQGDALELDPRGHHLQRLARALLDGKAGIREAPLKR